MGHNYGYDYLCIIGDGATTYLRVDGDNDALVDKARQYATASGSGLSNTTTNLLPAANNFGSSLFDGSAGYITLAKEQLKNGETTGAGDISVECWIRPASDQSATDVIGIADKQGCFGLYLAYGKPTFFTQKSGGSRMPCSASTAVSVNTNYHLVGTYNSSTGDMKIYVNGSLANTVNVSGGGTAIDQANAANFNVGSWDTSTLFFHGNISNVAIYDGTVLTSTQVSNHYNYAG